MKVHLAARDQDRILVTQAQAPAPTITADQLLVQVRASGLNRGELLALKAGADPKRFGIEVAGEVVAVGQNVAGWAVGDRVMGRCNGGGFVAEAVVDGWEALPIPAHLSFAQGAGIPLVFAVAWDMLRWRGGVQAGDAVLIAGASSGVGTAALLLAKALGAKVIGTSRDPHKREALCAHGLDVALGGDTHNLAEQVRAATGGEGVKLAINVVGGSVFPACLASLDVAGSVAIVGHMDNAPPPVIDLNALHERRLSVFGVSNRLRTRAERIEVMADFRERVLPLFESGAVTPLVSQTLPEASLQQAVDLMASDTHLGKIVVTW